jgi:hypothetical protein
VQGRVGLATALRGGRRSGMLSTSLLPLVSSKVPHPSFLSALLLLMQLLDSKASTSYSPSYCQQQQQPLQHQRYMPNPETASALLAQQPASLHIPQVPWQYGSLPQHAHPASASLPSAADTAAAAALSGLQRAHLAGAALPPGPESLLPVLASPAAALQVLGQVATAPAEAAWWAGSGQPAVPWHCAVHQSTTSSAQRRRRRHRYVTVCVVI